MKVSCMIQAPGNCSPRFDPVGYRVSVERALARLQASDLETAWSDALSTSQGDVPPVILTTQEGMIWSTVSASFPHRRRMSITLSWGWGESVAGFT